VATLNKGCRLENTFKTGCTNY